MNRGSSSPAKRGCVPRSWISPARARCVEQRQERRRIRARTITEHRWDRQRVRRPGAGRIRRRVAELHQAARSEEGPEVLPPLVLAHERPARVERRVAGFRKPPQGASRSRPLSRVRPVDGRAQPAGAGVGRGGTGCDGRRRTGRLPRRRSRRGSRSCRRLRFPTTAWRVHATRSDLYRQAGNDTAAEVHRARAEAIILALANSFAPDDPLRDAFLAAAPVRRIRGVADAERGRAKAPGLRRSRSAGHRPRRPAGRPPG